MCNTTSTLIALMSENSIQAPRRRNTVSEPCTPYKAPKAKRRRSLPLLKQVQFSETSEIMVVNKEGTSNGEWYTLKDHTRFKQDRIYELLSLRQSGDLNIQCPHPSTCPVGLEQYLNAEGYRETQLKRKLVIEMVLLEQSRQRVLGHYDEYGLAEWSRMHSVDSMMMAQKRGKFQELAKFV